MTAWPSGQKAFTKLRPADAGKLGQYRCAGRDPSAGQKFQSALRHLPQGTRCCFAVGPDLTSEFRRAEETIVHDILAPSATIVGGYETTVETGTVAS